MIIEAEESLCREHRRAMMAIEELRRLVAEIMNAPLEDDRLARQEDVDRMKEVANEIEAITA